jgi:ketosteroid isomerase-like protein
VSDASDSDFLATVTRRQEEAEAALVMGDAGRRTKLWSHRDPVSLFAAVGPSVVGSSQVHAMLPDVAARLANGSHVHFEVVAHDVLGEIGWIAGFSRFNVSIDGAPARDYVLRLTQIYRREDGEWKMTHEHSNFEQA